MINRDYGGQLVANLLNLLSKAIGQETMEGKIFTQLDEV